LFYTLFDSPAAKARIHAGTQMEYLKARGVDDVDKCFTNKQCTEKFFADYTDTYPMSFYYCGDCVKRFGYANSTVGSIDRIFNPQPDIGGSGYVSIAMTEHFRESFELLKCALPSYFALSIDEMSYVNVNVGTVKNKSYPLLDSAFQRKCIEDEFVYSGVNTRFWKILSYIRKHPECCRRSK
jgi:hypothetical protein